MRRTLTAMAAMLAVWVVYDVTRATRHGLRATSTHEVARLETAMWRSYYDHQRFPLFAQLATLLRRQFQLPFCQSCQGAWHAARSAVVFQRGKERPDYLRALPDLVD